jgi:hypothetical protein
VIIRAKYTKGRLNDITAHDQVQPRKKVQRVLESAAAAGVPALGTLLIARAAPCIALHRPVHRPCSRPKDPAL